MWLRALIGSWIAALCDLHALNSSKAWPAVGGQVVFRCAEAFGPCSYRARAMTRWLWLLLLLCCHCQELPELPAPPKELTWQDRLLDRLFTSLLTCALVEKMWLGAPRPSHLGLAAP